MPPPMPRKRRMNEAAALWEMQSSYQLQVGGAVGDAVVVPAPGRD